MVKTLCFHCRGLRFNPWSGNYDAAYCTVQPKNKKIKRFKGFPGGSVVKSPPASVGDTGLIPGLAGSHMLRSNGARKPRLLSLCSRA